MHTHLAAALALSTPVLAQDLSIETLAPPGAAIVVHVPDMNQAWDTLQQSALGDLWNHPEMQEFIEAFAEEMQAEAGAGDEDAIAWLRDLDYFADDEDLTTSSLFTEHLRPESAAGLAAWFTFPAQPGAEPEVSFLLCAGYDDRADDVRTLVDEMFEKAENDELIEYEEEDFANATIITVTFIDRADQVGMQRTPWGDQLHMTQLADVMVLSSDKAMIEDAIDAADAGGDTLGDDPDHLAFLDQHPDNADAYAYIRPDAFLSGFLDGFGSAMGFNARGIAEALCIDHLDAAGLSYRLDTADALVETRYSILASDKCGLIELFEQGIDGYEPPAFVGADTASVTTITFDFSGLIPLANKVIDQLAEDQRAMARPGLQQVAPMVTPLFEAMGPPVHIIQNYETPYSATSQRVLVVIEMADELVANNLLAMFGPQIGVQAREFEGAQIYDTMGGPSIGIGAGQLFIGETEPVEDALRAAANPDGPALASEPAYERAARALTGDGVMHSFSSIERTLGYMLWTMQNQEAILREQFEGAGDEFIDDMIERQLQGMPRALQKLPDAEVFYQFVGDTITEVQSTDDGYIARQLILHAE